MLPTRDKFSSWKKGFLPPCVCVCVIFFIARRRKLATNFFFFFFFFNFLIDIGYVRVWFTCTSLKFSELAISDRSVRLRYFFAWNSRSNSRSCSLVNAVRLLRILLLLVCIRLLFSESSSSSSSSAFSDFNEATIEQSNRMLN